MLKDSMVTNCHEFMKSIFKIPGTLKRNDIEKIRSILSKSNNLI